MSNPLSSILVDNLDLGYGEVAILERELTWLYGVAREKDGVFFRSGSVVLDPAGGVIVTNPETGDPTVILQADGDSFFGSDLNFPANTALAVFANDNIYNSESLGEGDLLIGDNSSGKANMLWDVSTGRLNFRGGTTVNTYIDVDGTIHATSGVFSGTITATGGAIGGWDITSSTIQKSTIVLDSANDKITVGGTDVILDGSGITAIAGAIGGWTIDSQNIFSGTDVVLKTWPSAAIEVADGDVILDATGISIVTSTIGDEQTKQLKFWYDKPTVQPMATMESYYSAATEHLFTIASYEVNSRDTDIVITPKGNLKLDGYWDGGSEMYVRDFDVVEFQDGNVEIHQQLHLGSLGDTYLYRQGVAEWRTNSSIVVDGTVSGSLLFSSIEDGATGGYKAGASSDVHLYRSGANTWYTPDAFQAGLWMKSGTYMWAAGDGSGGGLLIGTDCTLYRSSANNLLTPDTLTVSASVWSTYFVSSGATALYLRNNSARINFRTADDVNLYRWAANSLRTNDQFTVDGTILAGYNDATGKGLNIYHGTALLGTFSATDGTWTRLNQGVAKSLYTPRSFRAEGGLVAGNQVGTTNDVTYRGNLAASDGTTLRNVYAMFPLQAEISSATFFGTGKGNSAGAYYTVSSEFSGVPSAAKAVVLNATIKHTSIGAWFECGVNSTNRNSVVVYNHTTSTYNANSGIVPLDASGRIYIRTSTNSMEIWLRCVGYFV